MGENIDFNKQNLEKDLWELEKRQSTRRRVETILKLYSLLGLVVAVFGIAYFILTTLDIEFTRVQQMALLISGTGIFLSVTSWALLMLRRERMKDEVKKLQLMQELSEFIWKWSKFEAISKEVLLRQGKEFNKYSIREIIEHLSHEGIIDKSDILLLEEAIQARNMAVHGGGSFPNEMIARYSQQLDEVISKIQHIKSF